MAEKPEGSYTARLVAEGPGRIAQKVGEEGVETALAAVTRDDAGLLSECADLVYHLVVLLKSRNLALDDLVAELRSRHDDGPDLPPAASGEHQYRRPPRLRSPRPRTLPASRSAPRSRQTCTAPGSASKPLAR